MSKLIQLEGADPLNNDFQDNVPSGNRLLGLLYSIEGTSDSAQSLISANLGSLTIDLFTKQRYNVPLGFFHHWAREHEGTLEQTTPTAGPTRLEVFIPFYYPEEPNAIPVSTVRDLVYDIQHDQGTLDTVFDQGAETPSAKLSMVVTDRVAFNYVPEYIRARLPFSGADTDDAEFNESDITHVYIREDADNNNSDITDQVDITVDGEQVTARGVDLDDIKGESTILSDVETPQGPWAHKSLMSGPPSANGYANTQTSVQVTTNNNGDLSIVRSRRLAKSQATT